MSSVIDTIGSPWPAYMVLVAVTVVARVRCGSWFSPAAFVGLVWSFFTGASLLVVDYAVPARGLWMLVALIVSIQLGALIGHELYSDGGAVVESETNDVFDPLIEPCRRYGLLCAGIAFAGCIYFLFSSLEEFGFPFTWMGVLEVGAKWTLLRYDDALEPWSVRLLVMWLHPAAILGGILFATSERRRDRTISILTLLPAFAYALFTAARAAILLGLTCWIAGYIAIQCVRKHGQLALFSAKRAIVLPLAVACMLGIFGAIDAVRDTSWSHAIIFGLHEQKLNNYIFGPPAAFATWYAHAELTDREWGARSFSGEFDALHLKRRIVGRYLETSNLVGTESTNVYTAFRDLVEDFGEGGATIVCACIGIFAGWMYHSHSRCPLNGVFWLSGFYATFLFSPIGSFFSFNGAALAWVVGWFVLMRHKPGPALLRASPYTGQEPAAL
ncbi:MAG TPA: O-antigen polymerase [Candidatus Sulfotelmatobacter sp.]|nr:O-antigen polymerase [Candidatus Sulfotelmatobacter sp.]